MTEVTARDLKNKTGSVLRAVRAGDRVVVTNRGRRIAVISPLDEEGGPGERERRSPEEAWKEIEEALCHSLPQHKTWSRAMRASRGRP